MLRQSKWIRWNPSEPASLSLLNSTLPILSTCPSFAGNSQTADLSIALWVSPYKYVALIFSLRPLSFLLLPFNQRKKSQYNSNKETNKAKGSKRQPLRPLLLKWGLAYLFLCIPLLAYQERKKERSEGGRKKGRKERKRERKKRRKEEREKGRKKERKEGRKEERKKVKSLSRVQLFATLWTVARQAPLSMGFSRQEDWSGLPFPSPGDLPNPGIKPAHVAGRRFILWATRVCSKSSPPSYSLHLTANKQKTYCFNVYNNFWIKKCVQETGGLQWVTFSLSSTWVKSVSYANTGDLYSGTWTWKKIHPISQERLS